MTAAIAQINSVSPARRYVGWWLVCVALLVAAMVTLGGLTRLTGSGLSITEWKPVSGAIPPLDQHAWQAEFANYQKIPQYWRENRGMTLEQFKGIFWWEWAHRLLGRLVGAVFLLPFIGFAATGIIPRGAWPRMVLLFALGGLQGAVGWWMVRSGLETRISVSQYRLAIHLGVAIILLGALLWTALEYLIPPPRSGGGSASAATRRRGEVTNDSPPQPLHPVPGASPACGRRLVGAAFALVGLVYLQILLGALVAGLHAGLIYNSWPSMNGGFIPDDAFVLRPWWRNFFENPGMAQFDHRMVAYVVAASALAFWFAARRNCGPEVRSGSAVLLAAILVQIALGIATLLDAVPLALAALHQATAVAVFAAALWNAYEVLAAKSQAVIPAKAGTQMHERRI
jgi:cytochrome c oxidase assembly protein subunit 15